MSSDPQSIDLQRLRAYVRHLDMERGHALSTLEHHQGEIRWFEPQMAGLPERLVIKIPKGRGFRRWLAVQTLRREAAAYQRLQGVSGIPACYGLIDDVLVLEYVNAPCLVPATALSKESSDALLRIIQALHARGVAHGDLKRHQNILCANPGQVWVLDFGTAVVQRSGLHPINRGLFRLLAQTDLNAWVKHSHGGYTDLPEDAQRYLKRSLIERVLSWWRSRNRANP